MSTGGPTQPRPTRNDRRDAAREKARALREEQKKRDRRTKLLIQGSVVVVILAGWSCRTRSPRVPARATWPATAS